MTIKPNHQSGGAGTGALVVAVFFAIIAIGGLLLDRKENEDNKQKTNTNAPAFRPVDNCTNEVEI